MAIYLSDSIYFRDFFVRPFVALEKSVCGTEMAIEVNQEDCKRNWGSLFTAVWTFQRPPSLAQTHRLPSRRHDEIAAPITCSTFPGCFPSASDSVVEAGTSRWDEAIWNSWSKPVACEKKIVRLCNQIIFFFLFSLGVECQAHWTSISGF